MGNTSRAVTWAVSVVGAVLAVIGLIVLPRRTHSSARLPSEESSTLVLEAPEGPSVAASRSAPVRIGKTPPLLSNDVAPPKGAAITAYDKRNFDEMGENWTREVDDPEWSLNTRTFLQAMIESGNDDSGAARVDVLAVRCRTSACRIDMRGNLGALGELLRSSQEQQAHVTYQVQNGDAGATVEVYLGKGFAEPTDAQRMLTP